MSEVMALESLVEQLLSFEGYWTKMRVPFKKPSGANSDLDVLGIKRGGRVVVAECKGWGSPEDYWNFDAPSRRKYLDELCREARDNFKHFLRSQQAKRLEIDHIDEFYLVLPGRVGQEENREALSARLKQKHRLPVSVFRLLCVHEVIRKLQDHVSKNMNERRKRYADTSLEMIRWVLRSGGRISWAN